MIPPLFLQQWDGGRVLTLDQDFSSGLRGGLRLSRQIEKARACALSDFDLVRLMIGQALALCAPDRLHHPVFVIPAEGRAGVVPKIEFREVAVKMLLTAMLVNAFHAAFENAEETFNRVGRDLRPNQTA